MGVAKNEEAATATEHQHWNGKLLASQAVEEELELPLLQDKDKHHKHTGKGCCGAAINNHVAVAKYLVDKGAKVDALGGTRASADGIGDLIATPLHWAARSGHVQMVTLLYKKGANLHIKDAQGYNALHLAVHAGHLMMIVYLVSIGVDVDSRDTMNRTPLMWSAYQGNSVEGMQELIRCGAVLDLVDSTGYTALHWATISQHYEFVKVLIKSGASTTIKDPAGKLPQDWAKERETEHIFISMLKESKYGEDRIGRNPLSKSQTNFALSAIPYFVLPICFLTLTKFAVYIAVPLLVLVLFLVQKYLIVGFLFAQDGSQLQASPLTNAICHATLFYVFVTWYRIFPDTSYLFWQHFVFLVAFVTCVYNLYACTTKDPGYLNKSSDKKALTIASLADSGKLTVRDYCTTCAIRRPVRSKHCRVCDRCVAKFDHHCPWTNNCIGVQNHREFILFSAALVVGAWMFDYLCYAYLQDMVPDKPFDPASQFGTCSLPDAVCNYLSFDFWVVINAGWAFLQSLWVLIVVGSQLGQIVTAYTTNEAINYHRFDYLIHPDDQNAPVYRKRYVNPFDMGPIGNCIDFWSKGSGPLKDISWFSLYEVPSFLFNRAMTRKGYNKIASDELDLPMEKLV
ncbi:Palmitoyltransferase zdhhc17 [Kappamyces sp. JEL0680]|nr:Palmitoyltransferase zdhhc17 [Kappamyces sp. JEL0680]